MVGSARIRRTEAIAVPLLRWYDDNQRDLPWRRHSDPYATWISEVMLQQTQVATVVPYFERWMKRFPTVLALANAPVEAVLSAWQGLGYYSRARNLQRSAQLVRDQHDGRLPTDAAELRHLPGIGRYTAGAIASIAFDLPEPAVDGNVTRVLSRLEALRGDPRHEPQSRQLWQLAAELVRKASPSRINQALMELGALICIADKPRCELCPLLKLCHARKLALTDQLPELPRRPKAETRRVVVLLVEMNRKWLVVRQPDSAQHWAGLFTFPYVEYRSMLAPRMAAEELLAQLDPRASLDTLAPMAEFTYPITRFRFQAAVFRADGVGTRALQKPAQRYASQEELADLALPAPHRRLCVRLSCRVNASKAKQ